tara:strand:+ start:586 stop:969 length:384 start_codon:yes stop_codon:yes gene_type:complete
MKDYIMKLIEKNKFICENISNLSDLKNNLILDYIELNNIIYSENKNGIFINLSLCDEKHIHYFYEVINSNSITTNNKNKNNMDENENNKNNKLKNNLKKISTKLKQNMIKDFDLNLIEKKILSYSFQ